MTAFIFIAFQTIKTFRKWNRTLTRISGEYPALVLSVHRAHPYIEFFSFLLSTDLLMFTALKPVSNTVLHRHTSLAPHYAVPQLQSTFTLQSKLARRNSTYWFAVTRLAISCCSLASYAAYCISRINSSVSVSAGYPILTVSLSSRVATLLGALALYCTTHTEKNVD